MGTRYFIPTSPTIEVDSVAEVDIYNADLHCSPGEHISQAAAAAYAADLSYVMFNRRLHILTRTGRLIRTSIVEDDLIVKDDPGR